MFFQPPEHSGTEAFETIDADHGHFFEPVPSQPHPSRAEAA